MEEYIRETCKTLNVEWVVYILRSWTKPNMMYVGCTNNIVRRLRQHNGLISGGAKYTRAYKPWCLAALVPVENQSDALSLEYWAKAKNYKSKAGIPRDDPVIRRLYLIHKSMVKHNYRQIVYCDEEFKRVSGFKTN